MGTSTGKFTGKTILVADDEPAIREILNDELQMHGAHVLEAENGKVALSLLEKNKIDLVISDIRMPGGDGIEFIKEAKKRNLFLPVFLFVSAYCDLTRAQVYSFGAESILSKPFDLSEIINQVEYFLNSPEKRLDFEPKPNSALTQILKVFSDLNDAMKSGSLSLGRGGIFLANSEGTEGSHYQFTIKFESGELLLLEGTGICRWVRSAAIEGLPLGIGLEFQSLPKTIRTQVIEMIERLKPIPYIPLS